ncbi:uncharacterized protein LOC114165605 [Vigna unguiculata]|uniref:uncharacterized protein LOC114165605 n=1 Tax=Vigna unguiculata TaxID=3917 RepID=UPI001016814C|nr:uncharacterized protein LOC114165605 [Vigna unguiculata]
MASCLKKLKSLVISDCPIMEKIFKTEGNSADKVCIFPKLEEVHLSKMNKLTDIWQTKVSADSFSSLISVNIEECNNLGKIFPSHMEGWFESLDNLKVSGCYWVDVIFEINDSKEIDRFGGIDTNLQVLLLENLPMLTQLWSTNPEGILRFKKLRTIEVCYCNELRSLFPTSVAKDASKLERISALHCKNMVEIFASKDASEANNDPFEFPELTYVKLDVLPNIKHFYGGRHPIKCPKLKELRMGDVKLNTIIKETRKTTNKEEKEEKCVFSAEEVLSNLECMEIDFKDAHELLLKYQMHRLKELSLISVENVDLLNQFPYRMPNLEKLNLISSYFGEVVARTNMARQKQKRLGIVLQLKELVLKHSRIEDLGFERDQVLERLEVLRLENCHELSNLGPSSASLTYLTYLELRFCEELRNLMSSSTAKSMVQLKTMKVIHCRQVDQIVSNEGSEEGKEKKIVFSKLISIELVGLMNMTSFCSCKECEFEFPSLEILIVRECPKMMKFSEREPITPKLKDVFGVEGDEKAKWQWKGDLNATIQKVFNDKVIFSCDEYIILSGTEYIEVWHGHCRVQQNSFGYLKELHVWGCDSVVHVIPYHLLSCFHNLEELEVEYCQTVQVIFNISDENRARKASRIFRLKKLTLIDLPNLEHVWDKDPEGIIGLQMLKEMCVNYCSSLRRLFPASMTKDLIRLKVLEVRNCEELTEIFRKDDDGGDEGTTPDSVFPRLTSLTLKQLPRLKYSTHFSKQQESISILSLRDVQVLWLGSRPILNSCFGLLHFLSVDGCQFLSDILLPFNLLPFLTNLESLQVKNCAFVKTIFDVKCTTQGRDVTSMGLNLPFSLKKLTLCNLPNLKNVWNEDPRGILRMHHLQEVHVENCKELSSVFPTSVAKYLVVLEILIVKNCEGLMTLIAEDNIDPSLEVMFPCRCVRSMELRGLPKLKYFYYFPIKSNTLHLESHTEDQLCSEKV